MSRSRSRVHLAPNGGSRFWAGVSRYQDPGPNGRVTTISPSPFYPGYCAADNYNHRFDQTSRESMVDVSAPHGDRSVFHACTHTKVCAARFQDSSSVIFPAFPCYDYGYYQFVDSWAQGLDETLWISPEDLFFASALNSALASASWLDETVALARSVSGLVNSKTLLGATIKEIPETVRMVLNPFGLFGLSTSMAGRLRISTLEIFLNLSINTCLHA